MATKRKVRRWRVHPVPLLASLGLLLLLAGLSVTAGLLFGVGAAVAAGLVVAGVELLVVAFDLGAER